MCRQALRAGALIMMRKMLFIALGAVALADPPAFADRGGTRSDGITRTGDVLQFAIPFSALVYSSHIDDWPGVEQLGYAAGSTLAATYILKYTIREERPFQDEDATGHTFPSGHTSFAFAGAGYWQQRYGWRVGAPMYAAASFVGYSRNHARMHTWLDISTGAAIGVGFNLLFTSRYDNENTQIQIAPTDGGAMLGFNAKF